MEVIQYTPHYGLRLPHPNNKLENDVMSLRTVLLSLDSLLKSMHDDTASRATKTSTDVSVAHLDELINLAYSQLDSLDLAVTGLVTGKVSSVNGVFGENITLMPENLLLGPANGAASSSVTYDSQGRISTMTQTINGKNSITTLGYDSAGRVGQMQTLYNGRTRTEVITYGASGRLASTQASEVQA